MTFTMMYQWFSLDSTNYFKLLKRQRPVTRLLFKATTHSWGFGFFDWHVCRSNESLIWFNQRTILVFCVNTANYCAQVIFSYFICPVSVKIQIFFFLSDFRERELRQHGWFLQKLNQRSGSLQMMALKSKLVGRRKPPAAKTHSLG